MNPRITLPTFVLPMLMTALCGCGSNGLEGLVPGGGQLTFNGEPVEDATIVFAPSQTSGDSKRSATAITDAAGNFKLMTLNPNDGVFPGDYVVTVSKVKTEGGPSERELLENFGRFSGPDDRKITYLLPEKYGKVDESGLEITIPVQGKKDILLSLTGTVSGQAISVYKIKK